MYVLFTAMVYLGATSNRWGGVDMLRTIVIGSCVSVQGTFVRGLPDGKILVRVGEREFAGQPVPTRAA